MGILIDIRKARRERKQPRYYDNVGKSLARHQIMIAYVEITGNPSLPYGYGYWTLCNRQPDVPGSEINQMVNAGFLAKNQFFGIDNDEDDVGLIEANRKDHPGANWFKGDWLDVIAANHEMFSPALVHYDSTYTVTNPRFHKTLASTMNLCHQVGTMMVATAALSDGYSSKRFEPRGLLSAVSRYLHFPYKWTAHSVGCGYKSRQTEMGIFFFRKSE